MSHQRHGKGDNPLGNASGIHQLSSQDEEGYRHQREVVRSINKGGCQYLCIEHIHLHQQTHAAYDKRMSDGNPHGHSDQKRS